MGPYPVSHRGTILPSLIIPVLNSKWRCRPSGLNNGDRRFHGRWSWQDFIFFLAIVHLTISLCTSEETISWYAVRWVVLGVFAASRRKRKALTIIDSATIGGWVWVEHRLYIEPRTNDMLGTYEYPDVPMETWTFSVKPRQSRSKASSKLLLPDFKGQDKSDATLSHQDIWLDTDMSTKQLSEWLYSAVQRQCIMLYICMPQRECWWTGLLAASRKSNTIYITT